MSSADWYPMIAMGRYNTPIKVCWNGWEGVAVWLRAKPGEPPRWVQPVKRPGSGAPAFEPIPSRRQMTFPANSRGEYAPASERWLKDRGWGPEPDCWQPLGDWPDPLPEPIFMPQPPNPPGGRIDACAMTATEMAAEIEEMREAARCRPAGDDETGDGLPWWRDPAALTYSSAGAITEREAEGRVMRALYFLGGRDRALARYRSNAAVLADLMQVRDWGKSDFSGTHIPRLEVTRADTPERLLTAMRWACELLASDTANGWRWYALLERRARNEPQSWTKIAEFLGVAPASALRSYDRALTRLTTIANTGTPVLYHRLAATQEGNRRHADTR